MTGKELFELMERTNREVFLIGSFTEGIIVAPDMQGRFFTILNGKVVSRVVGEAITKHTDKEGQLNPGGDVLWPAPEGSCLGYMYENGQWRIPRSITDALWRIIDKSHDSVVIHADIELKNNNQVIIPCQFERHIKIIYDKTSLTQQVREVIRYTGNKTFEKDRFMLAPWSLCQLTTLKGGTIMIPVTSAPQIWDMYRDSSDNRRAENGMHIIVPETKERFQIGIGKNVPWIELKNGHLSVRRYAGKLNQGLDYIDIADALPSHVPSDKQTSLSVYCDPQNFVELEVCGGSPLKLENGIEISVTIQTIYKYTENEKTDTLSQN